MDEPKLFRRAVVGVVARQECKIDSVRRMAVHFLDNAT
jgi:hypothetical protein